MNARAGDAALGALQADHGPAVERIVVIDMIRRSLPFVPLWLALCAAIWGKDGGLSGAYGIALILANFVVSAWLLSWAARISLALLGAVALFGYLLRLGLITLAVLLVKDQSWVELVPLGLTIIVTHLGLLFWELRYVSTSMSFPGLKPRAS